MFRLVLIVLAFVVAARTATPDDLPATAFAVIVHPSTKTDDLSFSDLRRLFLGERQYWPGGTRVVLFVHDPDTPQGETLLRLLYRMSETEYRRYWIAKTFRDDVTTSPKLVSSTEMALRLTASIPGAITLIPAASVDSTVKVLTVEGLAPDVPDYPVVAQ